MSDEERLNTEREQAISAAVAWLRDETHDAEYQEMLDSVVAHIAALEQQQDKLRAALAWAIALIHDWWLAQGDAQEGKLAQHHES